MVVVPDFLVASPAYDYADAFEIDLPAAETRSPEQLFRAALGNAAWPQRWVPVVHRHMLRFRLGPQSSAEHILGWRTVSSDPDVIHLEASGPFIRGIIVGRRTSQSTAIFTTFIFYVRRVPARIVWAVAAPLHRRIAPYLLERGVMISPTPPL
ncbi:hypothetical protein A5662_24985 [Mycobacteriaceae bacterium 1482268.1]|nr:hypothetical protein A5662_24985 [Mycobacteriaceae bacterium 1482268.1]